MSRLVLASTSPRRRELLRERGIVCDVADPCVDESAIAADNPEDAAVELAVRKAHAVAMRVCDGFVLAADTIVWTEEGIFDKPRDRSDARRILAALSGRSHHVTTGYAVLRVVPREERRGRATSRVTMRTLEAADIDALVLSGECDDKAGAYALQGRAGAFVARVEGGRDTVIGLPVQDVIDTLSELGFRLPGAEGR
jgi:septum formation protein